MKIGIIGCRGIPNNYGGFEQFAEYLSLGLVERGAEVWVYNSHNHPHIENKWNGVNIIHCYDPEYLLGTPGQFIYDLNCINDSRKRGFDVLLQLGYTSSAIWHRRLPARVPVITNMDGLEWQRSKYSPRVRKFLRYAEKLAIKSSSFLVADSVAIQDYLKQEHDTNSFFIPYGAEEYKPRDTKELLKMNLQPQSYYLLIARMQPDNHVEEAIKGVIESQNNHPLLVVGSTANKYGRYLESKYKSDQVIFAGAIFNLKTLNQLRHNCRLYFHGHSSGGTNPSLLEAMAASAPICAHDNPFNRAVLHDDAFYFSDAHHISDLINLPYNYDDISEMLARNLDKIKTIYTWNNIIEKYWELFKIAKTG